MLICENVCHVTTSNAYWDSNMVAGYVKVQYHILLNIVLLSELMYAITTAMDVIISACIVLLEK